MASALNVYESDVLVATPGAIIDLEDAWDRQGVEIESVTCDVRSVLMLGQTVTGGLRHHVLATWAADVAISPTVRARPAPSPPGAELGCCTRSTSGFVLEVRTGNTLLPFSIASRGEMVVTPLQADATVLLRYATGDTVRLVDCTCGTPGTAFVVEGREDDVILAPKDRWAPRRSRPPSTPCRERSTTCSTSTSTSGCATSACSSVGACRGWARPTSRLRSGLRWR